MIAAPGQACLPPDAAPFWLFLLSLTMFVVAIGYVVINFVGRGDSWSQGRFLSFVVLPTVIGTTALTLFWSAYPCEPDEAAALFVSAVLPAAGWLVIGALARPSLRTAVPTIAAAVATVAGVATSFHYTGPTTLPPEPPRWDAGPTLLCIHGAGGNAGLWRPLLAKVAPPRNAVALDLPGHGRSGSTESLGSVPAYADFVREFAKAHRQAPDLATLAQDPAFKAAIGEAVAQANKHLSAIERIRRFHVMPEPFTVENGLMTPTLKLRRHLIVRAYRDLLEGLYGAKA